MIKLYTIVSPSNHIIDTCQLHTTFNYDKTFQARPGMELPILIKNEEGSRIVMATWGIEPTETYKEQVNVISTDKILKIPPFNVLMKTQRCAILANCFFAKHEKEVYLVRLIRPRLFCIGGIYVQNGEHFHFSMLKTASADILASIMNEMPLVFSPERLHVWLQSEHTFTIMNFASKAGGHWFDYFRVNSGILSSNSNTSELLKPIGMSLQQFRARRDKLESLEFEGERANRKSMKH